jgi:putative ribosome biogenesis GTPase RsgA
MPLSVRKTKRLVDKTKKYENYLKGKKVYILIGSTGAGKSTSIYYWRGQEMVEKKVYVEKGESFITI